MGSEKYEQIALTEKDLIRPSAAIAELEALLGGAPAAKKHLVDKIKDEALPLYAKYRWLSRRPMDSGFRSAREGKKVHYKEQVPPQLFRKTPDVLDLAVDWPWSKSRFSLPRFDDEGNFKSEWILQAVRFRKADIHLMKDSFQFAIKVVGQRGRPVNEERWDDFTVSLVKFSQDRELYETYLANFAAFEAAFFDFFNTTLADRPRLSKSTTKRTLTALYHSLKDQADGRSTHG